VCVCVVCIQMEKENIKTAKKTAPCARWAWFFRLIGPGKNGAAKVGEIILRIYIYMDLYTHYIYMYRYGAS